MRSSSSATGATSLRAKSRTVSRSSRCSSVRSKSMRPNPTPRAPLARASTSRRTPQPVAAVPDVRRARCRSRCRRCRGAPTARRPTKWCRNAAAVDRAAPCARAGGVREVGVAALDQLGVARGAAAAARPSSPARSPAARDRVAQSSSLEISAGVGRAERDDDRAGQRREVDEPLGAELARVQQAVGEDQPALGVGVVDLDRRAVWRVTMSPGLIAVPDGMFSVAPITVDDAHRQPELGDRAVPRAPRRRRTCRTSSPPSRRAA